MAWLGLYVFDVTQR